MTPVTTEARAAAWVWAPPGAKLVSKGPPAASVTLICVASTATGPTLLPSAMSGSVILLQLESMLISTAPVTTVAHVSHVLNYVLNHVLKHEGHAELTLPLTCMENADPIPRGPWDNGPP